MERHRMEIIHHGDVPDFEYWGTHDGSIYLCRRKDEGHWQAIIDGEVVLDNTNPGAQAGYAYPVVPLKADSAVALASMLAMQENVHVLMRPGDADGPSLIAS